MNLYPLLVCIILSSSPWPVESDTNELNSGNISLQSPSAGSPNRRQVFDPRADELEASASSENAQLSNNSHRIVASGWPSTSPMWPSIDTGENSIQSNNWTQMIEPFIYADKPRSVDYSLLLVLNESLISEIKNLTNGEKPMGINLSFEYYFNCGSKITALPGIKIELDRKQFKYLEPNGAQNIKTKIWLKFNEHISITDFNQLSNHDWLKFSLVNRQSPSMVAIRRLKVEFLSSDAKLAENQVAPVVPPASVPDANSIKPPAPVASAPADAVAAFPAALPAQPNQVQQQPLAPPQPPQQPTQQFQEALDQTGAADQIPAASNILEDKIKPVGPGKKKGSWSIWGKRRKREVAGEGGAARSIVLACFLSDQCANWKAEDGQMGLQWSLARMPPSTNIVQSGYYYVSNQQNYGDARKLLTLSLNQTDFATIADQNSDHCIELALYVTEKTYLKLYRLSKTFNADNTETFVKSNLLLVWAPTVTSEFTNVALTQWKERNSLPNSRLLASEHGQNGWTVESICFGDFFANPKDCGAGNCYFGFEMDTDSNRINLGSTSEPGKEEQAAQQTEPAGGILATGSSLLHHWSQPEQVVGVALLKEYTLNLLTKQTKSNWLETWQRDEVEPVDSWKFYPKLDFQIGTNNISLMNLFDDARYFVMSDWLNINYNLDLTGTLAIEVLNFPESLFKNDSLQSNSADQSNLQQQQPVDSIPVHHQDDNLFQLKISTKLVDSNFDLIYTNNSTIDWPLRQNQTLFNLGLPIAESILATRNNQLRKDSNDDGLFKIVFNFILSLSSLSPAMSQFLANNSINYKLSLVNISVSDRCFPNPCQFGTCQQNGIGYEDWNCHCDDRHRGRRCEFGKWCNLAHVTPWQAPQNTAGNSRQSQIVLKTPDKLSPNRQVKLINTSVEGITRISGKEYCLRKLGLGFKCTDIDLPLNDNLYVEEEKTFYCSCQDDFYLSDDSKCKQAHLCNSVLCPSIGMICDESKPFNRTQPCQCNEKQDWFPEVSAPDPINPNGITKCIRRQCHDIKRDCSFNAHLCLPTLPGEKPICKCGPKFTLKSNERGEKFCESTACVLPTLNDCQQICQVDNENLEKPYKCACHPGYSLNSDGKTCSLVQSKQRLTCKPSCQGEGQICTESGCKCKQGYVGEGEVIVQQTSRKNSSSISGLPQTINYTQSIRCLNVCSLSYAENKAEFEMVESVCPLGLCDPSNFYCRCSDPTSSALIHTKYEPIYANSTSATGESNTGDEGQRVRSSPLCHLRRVCEPNSSSYKICRSQGAICVPDYTKAAMFDCICPPSSEKKFYGQGTSSEFTCELKCSAKKYDCLRKQAVCKLVDKDQVRCDCLPGLMFDEHDKKCYLAKYSYAFNLIVVNRYYEPESKFHKILNSTAGENSQLFKNPLGPRRLFGVSSTTVASTSETEGNELPENEIITQFSAREAPIDKLKRIFITDYNQCNITQVIPKSVIEDPYEHDIESYLSYIDQCNEKIHQNVRTYHLNSKLSEDLRQSLRQHLRDFTVTTNNGSCFEIDSSGSYLNCTIYLQSNEVIQERTINHVFNDCDKNAYQSDKFCWIKPRLLLKKVSNQLQNVDSNGTQLALNFHQVVACEIDNFCGPDAFSYRLDDKTSLCSCKCPHDIEVVDVKDLEARRQTSLHQLSDLEVDPLKVSVKEICAPRNHCGVNSTFCLAKTGSICHYDIRSGSRCNCVYPAYEDSQGKCVEVTFSQFDSTLIIIIILLITALLVSMAINMTAAFRSKSLFGRSKQYPLNEFPTSGRTNNRNNRSTGIPNPAFTND